MRAVKILSVALVLAVGAAGCHCCPSGDKKESSQKTCPPGCDKPCCQKPASSK